MCNRIRYIAGLLAVVLFTLFSNSLQAQLVSEDQNSIHAEIAAALENYHHVFSTGTPSEIANQIYGAPLTSISTNGVTTVWNSTNEVEEWVSGFLYNLKEQGWYRSSMPSPSICVLGPNSGFASGEFIRYREDGSEISRNGMTYIFQRKSEGWRMTTFLAHDSNVELTC